MMILTILDVKTVLFQTIQFSKGMQFSSICPRNRTISGTTTPGQCGTGSDCNEGVLHIPQPMFLLKSEQDFTCIQHLSTLHPLVS